MEQGASVDKKKESAMRIHSCVVISSKLIEFFTFSSSRNGDGAWLGTKGNKVMIRSLELDSGRLNKHQMVRAFVRGRPLVSQCLTWVDL